MRRRKSPLGKMLLWIIVIIAGYYFIRSETFQEWKEYVISSCKEMRDDVIKGSESRNAYFEEINKEFKK